MAIEYPPNHQFMSMVEVKRVNGIFIDIQCWDFNDHVIPHVFAGELYPPPEEGDIYLMGLDLDGNLWKATYCSGKYETFDFDENSEYDEEGNAIPRPGRV